MTHPADAGKEEDTTEEPAGHDAPHPSADDPDPDEEWPEDP